MSALAASAKRRDWLVLPSGTPNRRAPPSKRQAGKLRRLLSHATKLSTPETKRFDANRSF